MGRGQTCAKWAQCEVCGFEGYNEAYIVRKMMHGTKEPLEYLRCMSCGGIGIVEIPRDLVKHYADEHYSFAKRGSGRANRLRSWAVAERNRWEVFGKRWIGMLLGKLFPTNALDFLSDICAAKGVEPKALKKLSFLAVGCGSDELLLSMREMGFVKLTGVDPFLKASSVEEGRDLRKCELSENESSAGFDVAMMNHSMEHMPSQKDAMGRAKSLLAPGGVLVVRIPSYSSWAWVHCWKNWVQWCAERHLFIHSNKSFEIFAANAGLAMLSRRDDSTGFQFWGSKQYVQGIGLADGQGSIRPLGILSRRTLKKNREQSRNPECRRPRRPKSLRFGCVVIAGWKELRFQ